MELAGDRFTMETHLGNITRLTVAKAFTYSAFTTPKKVTTRHAFCIASPAPAAAPKRQEQEPPRMRQTFVSAIIRPALVYLYVYLYLCSALGALMI